MPTMPSVLVVDDDAGMVDTLSDILAARGYQVAMAGSGQAAVGMMQHDSYDVVLMDIQMAGLNGVDALKAMKARTPQARVIMMTAFTRHELVEEARRATALAVLAKPLDIEQVLALIGRAIRAEPGG
jgi:two-component system, NtrC family, response regulator HydG